MDAGTFLHVLIIVLQVCQFLCLALPGIIKAIQDTKIPPPK